MLIIAKKLFILGLCVWQCNVSAKESAKNIVNFAQNKTQQLVVKNCLTTPGAKV